MLFLSSINSFQKKKKDCHYFGFFFSFFGSESDVLTSRIYLFFGGVKCVFGGLG
jgi:hypothetical protein